MKILILLAFFWFGTSFTSGIREPNTCGNYYNFHITSLQSTNEDKWPETYQGDMFTALSGIAVDRKHVQKFSWEVRFNGRTEKFVFEWVSTSKYRGYYDRVTDENTQDGVFDVGTTTYPKDYYFSTTIHKRNIATRVGATVIKFTTNDEEGNDIRQCSIKNINFNGFCGDDSNVYLTPKQGTNGYEWAAGYYGIMFTASAWTYIDRKTVHRLSLKVESNEIEENFEFIWNGVKYNQDTDSSYNDRIFDINIPTYHYENLHINYVTIKISKIRSTVEPGQINLQFTASDSSNSIIRLCSVNNIIFKECQTDLPLLIVNSGSSKYLSEGQFSCTQGYHLITTGKNTNTRTKCLKSAKWENQDDFNCYKAPNDTRIEGNLEIKENEKMEIYCNFTQTTPHAYLYMFSFGDDTSVIAENTPFTRKITIEDDGKEVWCHPQSKYTVLSPFLEEEKSPTRKLRVLFAPRAINNDNHTCNWTIGDENSCNFTFKSRPSADDISLFVVNDGATTIKVDFDSSNSSNGDKQTITIYNIKTSELETRKLQLRVSSSLFPQIPIDFDLIVVKETNQQSAIKSSSQLIPIIVGISVGIIFIILLILLVVVKKRQTTNKNNNTKPADGGVVGGGINEAIYETADDAAGNSAREERCNVIYAGGNFNAAGNYAREERYNVIYESGGNGAAGNSTKEERCNVIYESGDVGAEERVNPLYGSSSGQGSTKKTNIKKKKAGNYNEKKPSQNMNEDTDQFYATIDSNKNMNLRGKRPMQLPQTINDSELYSTVDASKKKNSKSHTSKQDPQNVSELYSTVNAAKKKKKNLPSSSTQETHNVSELYASVDVSKKTGKKSNIEKQNPSQLYASVKRK